MKSVRAAAEAAGRDPEALTICVAAPAYVGDDLAHAREQCRWFGGMVGNHVADLVTRYGETRRGSCGADRVHQGPRGLRLQPPRQGREPVDDLRPGRGRGPVLPARAAVGPAGATGGAARAGRGPVRDLRDARRQGGDDRGVREVGDPGAALTGRCRAGGGWGRGRGRGRMIPRYGCSGL